MNRYKINYFDLWGDPQYEIIPAKNGVFALNAFYITLLKQQFTIRGIPVTEVNSECPVEQLPSADYAVAQ